MEPQDNMPAEQPGEQEQSEDDQSASVGMMVPIKALGPAGMNLKPGSEISFTVDAVHGDMVELTPCDPSEEQNEMPSDDDAKSMPMDELESKLPQAER